MRPAVVVSSAAYHRARQEAVVAAITSNVRRRLLGDYRIANWRKAGLIFPSVATGILRTIKQAMIEKKLGALIKRDMEGMDRELRHALGL